MSSIVHAWEQHILCILVFVFRANYEILVRLVSGLFFNLLVNRCTLLHVRHTHITLNVELYL